MKKENKYNKVLTFMRTDSLSFSLFTIFIATLFPETQWTPSFTSPGRKAHDDLLYMEATHMAAIQTSRLAILIILKVHMNF